MGETAKYDLEPMTRGDTWRGVAQIGPLLINGAAPLTPVVSARMLFMKQPGGPGLPAHEITTGAGIQILNAAAWTFTVPPQVLPLGAGVWHWQFKTTDSAGRIRTYVGGTITLAQ